MSFAAATAEFAAQSARERRALSPSTIQPYSGVTPAHPAGEPLGCPLCVHLSATRATREITDTGFTILHRAQLRVLKTAPWSPVEGAEFIVTTTGERYRCATATGGTAFAAETVCDVVRIAA